MAAEDIPRVPPRAEDTRPRDGEPYHPSSAPYTPYVHQPSPQSQLVIARSQSKNYYQLYKVACQQNDLLAQLLTVKDRQSDGRLAIIWALLIFLGAAIASIVLLVLKMRGVWL